jgi:hypothetical protein
VPFSPSTCPILYVPVPVLCLSLCVVSVASWFAAPCGWFNAPCVRALSRRPTAASSTDRQSRRERGEQHNSNTYGTSTQRYPPPPLIRRGGEGPTSPQAASGKPARPRICRDSMWTGTPTPNSESPSLTWLPAGDRGQGETGHSTRTPPFSLSARRRRTWGGAQAGLPASSDSLSSLTPCLCLCM